MFLFQFIIIELVHRHNQEKREETGFSLSFLSVYQSVIFFDVEEEDHHHGCVVCLKWIQLFFHFIQFFLCVLYKMASDMRQKTVYLRYIKQRYQRQENEEDESEMKLES